MNIDESATSAPSEPITHAGTEPGPAVVGVDDRRIGDANTPYATSTEAPTASSEPAPEPDVTPEVDVEAEAEAAAESDDTTLAVASSEPDPSTDLPGPADPGDYFEPDDLPSHAETTSRPDPEPVWQGAFRAFEIGDPGRAPARTIPKPDWQFPDRADIAATGYRTEPVEGAVALDVRAASVRGLSHRYYGKVRQDSFGHQMSADRRWLVACVADGVSQGPFSHLAADVATTFGVERIVNYLDGGHDPATLPWDQLLKKVCAEIAAVAMPHLSEAGIEDPASLRPYALAREIATTVLYALVDTFPDDDGVLPVHMKEVGDTSGWVIRKGTSLEALQAIKNEGEAVASAAVIALPALPNDVGPAVRTAIGAGDALLLVTDGIGDPLGNGVGDVGEFIVDQWATPPPPLLFASQTDFARRGFDDDRTALGIWPVSTEP